MSLFTLILLLVIVLKLCGFASLAAISWFTIAAWYAGAVGAVLVLFFLGALVYVWVEGKLK